MSTNPAPQRGIGRYGLAAGVALSIAVAGYIFLTRPWEGTPQAVTTETVVPGPITRVLAVNGRVVSKVAVNARSPVAGQAVEVLAEEGDRVSAGQLIVRLDASQPRAQAAQATAALNAAIVGLHQAQLNSDRAKALGQNVPLKTLEDAALSLTAAEHEVERASAAVDQAQSYLSQFDIRAPFSGTILTRQVQPGQTVDPQIPLFTLADLSRLVVRADIDELYSAQVGNGLRAVLQPAGGPAKLAGHITFAAPVVDAASGGRTVEISLDEPMTLPVGLTVAVNVIVEELPSAISVPRGAIVDADGASAVFVVADGRAVRRLITVVDWPAARVLARGLSAGEQIVVDPAGLTGGQLVRPKQ